VILFLHNRYRTTGGEERVVDDLLWLVREQLGEEAELVQRDSGRLGRAGATRALLSGGLQPEDVAAAVRLTGARIVHAHNLLPSFGWRALAAARAAGAKTVLHLHNYRLVCAVGTCIDSRDADCVRCQGRDTVPGVRLRCRGSVPEAVAYGASLALWQRRMVGNADVVVVPSRSALERLRELSAPLGGDVVVLPHTVREFVSESRATAGTHALVASRLAREKDVATAIKAAELAQMPLVVAGDGPLADDLAQVSGDADVSFAGMLDTAELAEARALARVALVPSRAHETFGLAALEAMAQGVPVVAARTGALAELEGDVALVTPGDPVAMAQAIRDTVADPTAGDRAIAAARRRASPEVVARQLAAVYDGL
jgi:glycosyltransferase involved in cell wall biosynthesis